MALNVLVQTLSGGGLAFASYFFHTQGLEFYKIIMIWAISPLASLPVVLLSTTWNIRKYLRYGLLAYTGMALSLVFFNPYSFLIFGVLNGLTLGFFWVSFNYIFFLNSTNMHHARDSSIYFILGPLVGVALPPLGALIIDNLGYRALFLITTVCSLVPLLYARQKDFDYTFRVRYRDADRAFSGLRLIEFLNGALHFFQVNFLAIYALLFLKTEYQVGGLISYLAFISLLVSFLLAYASDRFEKRTQILYPLMTAMGFLILLMPTFTSLSSLITIIGIYAVFDNLSLPIRFAIPMDMATKDIGFWRAAEVYENLGRTIVFAVAAFLLYLGNYWLPFFVFALTSFSFPFVVNQKIKALNKTAAS